VLATTLLVPFVLTAMISKSSELGALRFPCQVWVA
jgi:hypothetical protein